LAALLSWPACWQTPGVRKGVTIGVAVAVLVVASCNSSHRAAGTAPGRSTTTGANTAAGGASRTDSTGSVWLCRPGLAGDPCTGDLDAVSVGPNGIRTPVSAERSRSRAFDCFYVYPTVSAEAGTNADLAVQASETDVARAQASRFSQVCDVWAPMYRQVTLRALFTGGVPALQTAYQSLLSAWTDYLANYNHGRPIIFIGHSQGASMLIRLLASQVDPNPVLRARTLVAIIAGGNVQVATGQRKGGSFQNLPLCSSSTESGCVIAYSTFPSEPPAAALFGRPGQGVSLMSLQTAKVGQEVACVDPAALSGGTGSLQPYYPVPRAGGAAVQWVTYPDQYNATCHDADGASWLELDHISTAGDTRPTLTESIGPLWGYHAEDINVALGNLVDDVRAEEAAYKP